MPWTKYQQWHGYRKIQINPQMLQEKLDLPRHHLIAQEKDMTKFLAIFKQILDKHTSAPSSPTKENFKARMKPPWWNKEIMMHTNNRKIVCKQFMKHKILSNFIKYKQSNARVKQSIKQTKTRSWKTYASTVYSPYYRTSIW